MYIKITSSGQVGLILDHSDRLHKHEEGNEVYCTDKQASDVAYALEQKAKEIRDCIKRMAMVKP